MVADIEELENLGASEIHARRLNVREVLMPKDGEDFKFPVADGTVNCLQEMKFSEIHFNPGSPCTRRRAYDLQGETEGSQPLDTMTDDGEARNDF